MFVAGLGEFFNKIKEGFEVLVEPDSSQSNDEQAPQETYVSNETKPTLPKRNPVSMYGLTLDQNREIQELLITLGYSPGPADGLPGNKTKSAIKQYQSDYGLLITGTPSLKLLQHMQRIDEQKQLATVTAGNVPETSTPTPSYNNQNTNDTPQDILYSSLGDNQNYLEYQKIFSDQKIKDIVSSVESNRSVDIDMYSLLVLVRLYDQELPGKLGNILKNKDSLESLLLGQTDDEAIFKLLERLIEQVALENNVRPEDMKIFNDARNINQSEIVDYYNDVEGVEGWRLLLPQEAAFHTIGYDPETIRKYVNEDGKEYVFQKREGKWVFINDGVNSGT